MMKNIKKHLAFTAAALMVVSALAGCGNDQNTSEESAQQTSQADEKPNSVVDTWYLGGETDNAYIVLKDNGTAESYQAGNKLLASGTYTFDGKSVQITLTSTSGEKRDPDTFQVIDKDTLYLKKLDRSYIRASTIEAEKKQKEQEFADANAAQIAEDDKNGVKRQPLSDEKLSTEDVVGTWYYQRDLFNGTINFEKDGTMYNADEKGEKIFSGTYKLNGSKVEIYDINGVHIEDIRMQTNGQLTEDEGKTSYALAKDCEKTTK